MSWKPEVKVVNEVDWVGNGLRFSSKEEAEAYARNLACRWTSVRETRATESDDAVNSAWEGGGLVALTT